MGINPNGPLYNLTPEVSDIFKNVEKRRSNSSLFHNILLPVVKFSCLSVTIFHFEICGYLRSAKSI